MAEERSFEELMASLRAGDNDAAASVFNRFAQRLIARNWIHAGDWVHQHDPAFRWRVS